MTTVVALIHGAKAAYGLSFPDFPGCVAGGETISEALARGRDALAFHLESMIELEIPLPKIRDLDDLKSSPEFVDDFADAVLVAAVDADLPGRITRVNITLDQSLVERIDRRARELGESRSGFLAAAARSRLAG